MIKKVIILSFINFIFLIVLGFVSFMQIGTLTTLTKKLYDHPFTVSNATRVIQTHIVSMHRYMKDLASAENMDDVAKAKQYVDNSQKIIFEQFDIIFERYLGDKQDIQTSYDLFLNWEPIRNEVINLIKQNKRKEAFAITKGKGAKYIAHLDLEINKLTRFAENKAITFQQKTLKAESEAQELIIVLLILISFFSFSIFVVLLQNISKKNKEISDHIQKIEFNYEFEQFTNNISKHLIYGNDIDICINNTLKELGEALNAHRAYIFLFKNGHSLMDNTHEWCSHGTRPEIDNLQNIDTQSISWWVQQCVEHKPIILESLDDLPEDASTTKAVLLEQDIKSLLVYPVAVNGQSIGFIGIDMVHHSQKWTDTHHSFVRLTAESIANAFEKKEYIQEIFDSRYNMALTLNTASNGVLAITEDNHISFYNQKLLQIWELDTIDSTIDTLEKLFNLISYQFNDQSECLTKLNHFYRNRKREQTYFFTLKNKKIIEIISSPSFDNGVFKGNSISFRDVTKKTSDEQELQLSAKVFENSLEGIIITDDETNIIKVNDSFLRITGYSRGELLGIKPTILQSDWHDKKFYDSMWESLHNNCIWEGELKDRRKDGELYINLSTIIMIKDSNGKITNYIGINRDITDMKKSQEHIKALAYHDSLTKLPNRTLFYDRLAENLKYCQRNEGKMALLFIDLDNFKTVNDTHGHHAGDLLLLKVASIIKDSIRASDTVSRLGGDEFTIILRKIHKKEDVAIIANKIISQLKQAIQINNLSLQIGSSIGAAIYPDDSEDKDMLIKMADEAMYSAKNSGKNCLKFFGEC